MFKLKGLFYGKAGAGKTYCALTTALHFAKQGYKVLYLDLENGTDKAIVDLAVSGKVEIGEVSESVVNVIINGNTLKILKTLKWIDTEYVVYSDTINKYDLVVLDGISEVFNQKRDFIELDAKRKKRFISPQGGIHEVKDPETFVLPFFMYPPIYDDTAQVVRHLTLKTKPHVIMTLRESEGESSTKQKFEQDIFALFDFVFHVQSPELAYVKKIRGFKKITQVRNPAEECTKILMNYVNVLNKVLKTKVKEETTENKSEET